MVGSRGGRRRPEAGASDPFRDALARGIAEALGVDERDVALSLTVAGSPVDVDLLPVSIKLSAPAATEDDAPEASDGEASDVADAPKAAVSAGEDRGDRADRPRAGSAPRAPRDNGAAVDAAPVSPEELDEEAEAAADLLEGLLDAMDLPGDLRISVQEAHAEVEVVGLEEGVLIGRRGQTLEAVQELVRTAMQRRFERRSRVMVDVDGYRARRLEKLMERAEEAVQEVLDSGEPQRLEPMDSIERRLVHQRVATFQGVTSSSHGREPARRIVIELLEDD
jgi:spoIIIJ-associated protein